MLGRALDVAALTCGRGGANPPTRASTTPSANRKVRIGTAMSHLLRIALPDVPGSLGAVASALGAVGVNIEAIEIVEHRADGVAVDDFFIRLPTGRHARRRGVRRCCGSRASRCSGCRATRPPGTSTSTSRRWS